MHDAGLETAPQKNYGADGIDSLMPLFILQSVVIFLFIHFTQSLSLLSIMNTYT